MLGLLARETHLLMPPLSLVFSLSLTHKCIWTHIIYLHQQSHFIEIEKDPGPYWLAHASVC
jgi:hypothetical protein